MAVENAIYLTSEDIARRAGVYDTAYVTSDLRFILGIMDLKRVRFEAEEYINGLAGVEKVTLEEAEALITENGYRRIADMTDEGDKEEEEVQAEELEPEQDNEEAEQTEEPTADEDETENEEEE